MHCCSSKSIDGICPLENMEDKLQKLKEAHEKNNTNKLTRLEKKTDLAEEERNIAQEGPGRFYHRQDVAEG